MASRPIGSISSLLDNWNHIVVAIRDIAPRAPTHILLLSREHIRSADDLGERHAALLGRLFAVSSALAHKEGIADDGYRVDGSR